MKLKLVLPLLFASHAAQAFAPDLVAVASTVSDAPAIHLPISSSVAADAQGDLDPWVLGYLETRPRQTEKDRHLDIMTEHLRSVVMRYADPSVTEGESKLQIALIAQRYMEDGDVARSIAFHDGSFERKTSPVSDMRAADDIRAFLETKEGVSLISGMSPAEARAVQVFLAALQGGEEITDVVDGMMSRRMMIPGLTEDLENIDFSGGDSAARWEVSGREDGTLIREWRAEIEPNGTLSIVNPMLDASRMPVREGMVLGAFGRIESISDADASGAFSILLSTGLRIPGQASPEYLASLEMNGPEVASVPFGEIIVSAPPPGTAERPQTSAGSEQDTPSREASKTPPPRPQNLTAQDAASR